MKFIIGKKREMTQLFDGSGNVVPVTKIIAGPCFVSQVKTREKEGYDAVQLAFDKKKKIKKSRAGHLKEIGSYAVIKEFRVKETPVLKRGDKIEVSVFEAGERVGVTSFSKGKGFAGVVKRHHFHGHPATHGHKDQLRMPGSIGATDAARVFKGTRMAGRMGYEKVSTKNLEVAKVNPEKNEIWLKGAISGPRNEIVKIVGLGNKFTPREELEPAAAKKEKKEEPKEKPQPEKAVKKAEKK